VTSSVKHAKIILKNVLNVLKIELKNQIVIVLMVISMKLERKTLNVQNVTEFVKHVKIQAAIVLLVLKVMPHHQNVQKLKKLNQLKSLIFQLVVLR